MAPAARPTAAQAPKSPSPDGGVALDHAGRSMSPWRAGWSPLAGTPGKLPCNRPLDDDDDGGHGAAAEVTASRARSESVSSWWLRTASRQSHAHNPSPKQLRTPAEAIGPDCLCKLEAHRSDDGPARGLPPHAASAAPRRAAISGNLAGSQRLNEHRCIRSARCWPTRTPWQQHTTWTKVCVCV